MADHLPTDGLWNWSAAGLHDPAEVRAALAAVLHRPVAELGDQDPDTGGSEAAGAGGSEAAGPGGSEAAGTGGNEPAGTGGNEPAGPGGNEPAGAGGSEAGDTGGSEARGTGGGSEAGGAGGSEPWHAAGDRHQPVLCDVWHVGGDFPTLIDCYLVPGDVTEVSIAGRLAARLGTGVLLPDDTLNPTRYLLAAPDGTVRTVHVDEVETDDGTERRHARPCTGTDPACAVAPERHAA